MKPKTAVFFPVVSFVDRGLHDVFGIALNDRLSGNVGLKGQGRIQSWQAAYSALYAPVTCVKTAGEQLAQRFWDIVCCDEVLRISEGL